MSNYHVSKNKSLGKWQVKKENANRVSDFADTQKQAEKIAKQMSSNSGGGEVRIHGLNGKIRDSDTMPPANDPCPPKDRKF